MLKVLLWIVSNDGRFFQDAMNTLERQHNGIEVIGLTANKEIGLVMNGKDIPFIPPNEIEWAGADILLVVGAKQIGMSKVTQAARQLNFPEEKLLGDWIVCIPGFTLEKYRRLQRSRLSILSVNCIGGMLSHELGLPFRSPLVNLYLNNKDFLKFLKEPHVYLEDNLIYHGENFNSAHTYKFPVAKLGDVLVNMMHYKTFDESVKKWEERKQKINWYNLCAIMWTESPEELEQFDALPYGKKICFVPFKSDLDSAWYVEHRLKEKYPMYVHYVNQTAKGKPFLYDPFDMLLYGKKTPLIDM